MAIPEAALPAHVSACCILERGIFLDKLQKTDVGMLLGSEPLAKRTQEAGASRIGLKAMFTKSIALASCAARNWISDNASTTGASLAFFCAFSIAPLLVIVLTTAGWIVGANAAYSQIGAQLQALFGASTAAILLEAIKSSQQSQGLLATVVSAVTLLIGATTVLSALNTLLEQIWKSEALAQVGIRGWIRTRFLSLGFILTLGFLLLVSLTISTGISTLQDHIGRQHSLAIGLVGSLDLVVSISLIAFLFALIFRYMPAKRLPWKAVAIGGLLTAILFDAGRWAVSVYLAHSTQPSAFGAAASFATLLLWLYYTSLIFLFGAEYTACLGGLRDRVETNASGSVSHSPPRVNAGETIRH